MTGYSFSQKGHLRNLWHLLSRDSWSPKGQHFTLQSLFSLLILTLTTHITNHISERGGCTRSWVAPQAQILEVSGLPGHAIYCWFDLGWPPNLLEPQIHNMENVGDILAFCLLLGRDDNSTNKSTAHTDWRVRNACSVTADFLIMVTLDTIITIWSQANTYLWSSGNRDFTRRRPIKLFKGTLEILKMTHPIILYMISSVTTQKGTDFSLKTSK